MRVKTIETFKVPPRWLFVRIETESGLVGWGEPIVEGRADTVAAAVHEMKEHVVGRDAGHIEDIFQVLYRGAFYRGGPSDERNLWHRAGIVGHKGQVAQRPSIFAPWRACSRQDEGLHLDRWRQPQ